MTTTAGAPTTTGLASDAEDLAQLGYAQQLRRRLGGFASFAAGFSFISILTTVFQLFFLGFSFGGAAFFWTWPIVCVGQLMVALCFRGARGALPDLRLHLPVGQAADDARVRLLRRLGDVHRADRDYRRGGHRPAGCAAEHLDGFQLVGSDPSLTSSDGATNAVLLGAMLVTATTIVNALGVRAMATINSIGVTLELVGIVVLVVLLLVHAERGPDAVLHQTGAAPGGSYLGAFVVAALMAAYVMVGFDSAGELSEETHDLRRTAPRSIVRALVAAGVGGGLLILAAIMAAPSLVSGDLATAGLPYVLTSQLGDTVGKVLLADVAIAVCVCTMAIQTAAMRMIFSMSRDGALPFSHVLGKVSPRTGTPIVPALVTGVLTIALLAVNVGEASVFLALTSVCIVMLYLAYLMVTLPLLVRRLRGWARAAAVR